ncbi:MAG: hypothetical protein V1866_01445 [archaeon]
MADFNPDGSLRLPEGVMKRKEENVQKMISQQCMRVRKEITSHSAPKKCILRLTLSKAIADQRFIDTIFNCFKNEAKTPMKLSRTGEQEFEIEIGSDFKRCTECTALIGRYREFLNGKIIEEKGNCTFAGRIGNWSEEDYFD